MSACKRIFQYSLILGHRQNHVDSLTRKLSCARRPTTRPQRQKKGFPLQDSFSDLGLYSKRDSTGQNQYLLYYSVPTTQLLNVARTYLYPRLQIRTAVILYWIYERSFSELMTRQVIVLIVNKHNIRFGKQGQKAEYQIFGKCLK